MPSVNILLKDIAITTDLLIWIIYGVASCCPQALFSKHARFSVLEKSFAITLESCKSTCQHQFRGCSTLYIWWKQFFKSIKLKVISPNLQLVQSSWNLIKSNWDSQLSGLVDLLMQTFEIILDVLLVVDQSKISTIVTDLLSTSKSVKGKYGPLCICIKKLGHQVIFSENPDFVQDLIVGLGINHFASAVSKVYKAIAFAVFKKPNDNFDLIKWEQILGLPLVNALMSSSSMIHQNALSYWVLINLNLHFSVLPKLLDMVSNSFSEKRNDETKLSAQIGIFKIARNARLIHFNGMSSIAINQAFSSHNSTIRANVFWLICKNPKKCEPICETEFLLLQKYLPLNMNMDCTAFRLNLLLAMNYFLERICCTVTSKVKQNNSSYIDDCIQFLSFLISLCKSSFYKCFKYQRKITALHLYKNVLQYFSVRDSDTGMDATKDSFNQIYHVPLQKIELKEVARKDEFIEKECIVLSNEVMIMALFFEGVIKDSLLSLTTPSIGILLLDLMEDVVSEIRETSLFLLSSYYPSNVIDLHLIEGKCKKLLSSAKAQDSESGALLQQFLFQRYFKSYPMELFVKCLGASKANPGQIVLHNILENIKKSFSIYQLDFLNGALHKPLHGWLLALSLCTDVLYKHVFIAQANSAIEHLCYETEKCVTEIIHFFLKNVFSCVACSDTNDQQYVASADFQEMSRRIIQLICKTERNQSNNIFLSSEFEAISSASWLALKNSCDCLSSVGCLVLSVQLAGTDIVACWLKKLCYSFVTVLSMCRHRGVVESCHLAFVKYLIKLFNSNFRHIPVELFWSLLKGQGHNQVQLIEGGTITRRSAGIPFIIDAILTAYFSSSCHTDVNMLTNCINYLLDNLKFLSEIDEKLVCTNADLPQVDALYILKTILQNNLLASHVNTHLTTVLISTIQCLDSSLWVVRNAATHLSGIFAARMIGQKHIENDFTSSLSASEFFTRFPEFLIYVNGFFTSGLYIENSSSMRLHKSILKPSVYLIISLLSKLNYNFDALKSEQQIDVSFVFVTAQQLLSCCFYSVRTTAVKLLMASTSTDNILILISEFLSSLSRSFENSDQFKICVSQNALHGWLMLIHEFIQNKLNSTTRSIFVTIVLNVQWISDPASNPCPLTASLYLKVIAALYKKDFIENFDILNFKYILNELKKSNSWSYQVGFHLYVKAVAKCLVLSGDVVKFESLLLQFEYGHLLYYCFKYLKKYNSFVKLSVEFLLGFICNFWKSSQSHNLSAKVLSLSLLLKLKIPLKEKNLIKKPIVYETLSAYIFQSNVEACLSLKCLLIEAMSVVIVLEISQDFPNDKIKTHLNAWIEELENANFITCAPEPVRLSGALAMKIAAPDILLWIKKQQNLSDYCKVASLIFYFSLLLLHDEQSEVRDLICEFVAALNSDDIIPQHYCATENLLKYFSMNFPSLSLLDSFFKICCAIDVPDVSSTLYQKEAFNLYIEVDQIVLSILPYAKNVVKQIFEIPAKWFTIHIFKCQELLKTCNEAPQELDWIPFGMCCFVYCKLVIFIAGMYFPIYDDSVQILKKLLISWEVCISKEVYETYVDVICKNFQDFENKLNSPKIFKRLTQSMCAVDVDIPNSC